MLLGAHITTSKGLIATAEKAQAMGANCLQLFVSPPRNWNPPKWTKEQLLEFKKKLDELKIGPTFLHGIYLVNLHSENQVTRQKAIESAVVYQKIAATIGATGTIIHSHHPNSVFKSAIEEILERTQSIIASEHSKRSNPTQIATSVPLNETPYNGRQTPQLIVEHSAINTLEDTFALFETSNKDRLGFCLDTCHLFTAGYDIRNPTVVDEMLNKLANTIGLEKLAVIHLNDAKSQLGSHRDIHQNIGQGSIGKDPFAYWLNHLKLRSVPFIIETPGFDDQGPDKKNLDILKSLIEK